MFSYLEGKGDKGVKGGGGKGRRKGRREEKGKSENEEREMGVEGRENREKKGGGGKPEGRGWGEVEEKRLGGAGMLGRRSEGDEGGEGTRDGWRSRKAATFKENQSSSSIPPPSLVVCNPTILSHINHMLSLHIKYATFRVLNLDSFFVFGYLLRRGKGKGGGMCDNATCQRDMLCLGLGFFAFISVEGGRKRGGGRKGEGGEKKEKKERVEGAGDGDGDEKKREKGRMAARPIIPPPIYIQSISVILPSYPISVYPNLTL